MIHRTGRRGLGRSYVDGIMQAIRQPVDVICQMDADFSHDPKYLPLFFEEIKSHDLVIGSRYVNGISVVNWDLKRLILRLASSPTKSCPERFFRRRHP